MCCIFAVFGAFFPRIALLLMWIFTTYVDRAFSNFFIPLVGLIFLPYTTIMYCLVYNPVTHNVVGANWLLVALGLVLDIMSYGSGGYGRRARTSG